jgi:hypothetical protein
MFAGFLVIPQPAPTTVTLRTPSQPTNCRAPALHLCSGHFRNVRKSRCFRLPKHLTGCTLGSRQAHSMDTLDYVLAIGGILVFIFTIVMDVLLVREWIQKRRDKQKPPENSDT